jgi:hypothetical protein
MATKSSMRDGPYKAFSHMLLGTKRAGLINVASENNTRVRLMRISRLRSRKPESLMTRASGVVQPY